MATKKTTPAAKAKNAKSINRAENAPKAKHQAATDLRGLDSKTRAYHDGCIDGEHRAELYLQELRQRPGWMGAPLMGNYIRNIRPDVKDSRIRGLMVGFLARVEQEMARVLCEDAWRKASFDQQWQFMLERREAKLRSGELMDKLIAKLEAGEQPSEADYREAIASLDEQTLSNLRFVVRFVSDGKKEAAARFP